MHLCIQNLVLIGVLSLIASLGSADQSYEFGSGEARFNLDFVAIGDPGVEGDHSAPRIGKMIYFTEGRSVGYSYFMGKYEISRRIVEIASTRGQLGIELQSTPRNKMQLRPDMPATAISWNEAARFVNWLNEEKGYPHAYLFKAQPGESGYNPNDNVMLWKQGQPGFDSENPLRNSKCLFFLPSQDEWYKAAYYDSRSGRYRRYPQSNYRPRPVSSGTEEGTAVIRQSQGPADVMLAGGPSTYGVVGIGGNVWEWIETPYPRENYSPKSPRWVRGGYYGDNGKSLDAWSLCFLEYPTHKSGKGNQIEAEIIGFRVASRQISDDKLEK